MSRRELLAMVAALSLLSACGGTVTPDPVEVYRLEVRTGAVEPRSLLLSLDGIEGAVTVLAGGSVLNRVASPRVLLIGPLAGSGVLEVRAATPDVPPTATVLDASAGQAANYRRLQPGEVVLEWMGVR